MRPRQTHCKRGHERTPENVKPSGSCKPCAREATAAKRAARNLPEGRRKTHCKRGHERTPANLETDNTCRICRATLRKARRAGAPIATPMVINARIEAIRQEYNVRGLTHWLQRRDARKRRAARIALVRRAA